LKAFPLSSPPLFRRAIVVGLLIAVGAFAIDMYIPGFAAIAADFGADPGLVQLSMTSFFVALALGQVIYGPVSDAVGRRAPIFAGLALFAVASVGAALAPSLGALIAARFVQGFGAAGATVVPLAVIRDEYTGPDAARILSLAMLSLSVSPILAPVFGGLLVQFTSWRMIFVVLIVICVLIAVMTARMLPETLPVSRRVSAQPLSILATYGRLIGNRRFIVPVLIAACAQAVLFAFISASPFVFVTLHQVSPPLFGLLFACHAIGLIGISQFNAPMMRYFGATRLIGGASFAISIAAVALAILVAAGMTALWPFVLFTLTIFTGLGLILTPAFLTAMEPFGAIAGAAAAIAVGLEFTVGSVATFLIGITADGTARPLTIFLALAACGSFVGWLFLVRTPGRRPTP
jgi:DHA1 family bicyclomycin/chloramphenicol resistance-like MFS transporter